MKNSKIYKIKNIRIIMLFSIIFFLQNCSKKFEKRILDKPQGKINYVYNSIRERTSTKSELYTKKIRFMNNSFKKNFLSSILISSLIGLSHSEQLSYINTYANTNLYSSKILLLDDEKLAIGAADNFLILNQTNGLPLETYYFNYSENIYAFSDILKINSDEYLGFISLLFGNKLGWIRFDKSNVIYNKIINNVFINQFQNFDYLNDNRTLGIQMIDSYSNDLIFSTFDFICGGNLYNRKYNNKRNYLLHS